MKFDFFKKKKKTKEEPAINYRIGELLYLVDWKPYQDLINDKFSVLIEIYIFRAWLYNYTFRRTVSEVDPVVNDMLYNLINELNTSGNPLFVKAVFMKSGEDIDAEVSVAAGQKIQERMINRFQMYDEIVQKYIKEKQDLEAVCIQFSELLKHMMKQEGESITDEDVGEITVMAINDITKPVGDVAMEAMKSHIESL